MRTEAFSPWLCTCLFMMARFSEFPRAKQELPRQTTISTEPSSSSIFTLLRIQMHKTRRRIRQDARERLDGTSPTLTLSCKTAERINLAAQTLVAISGALIDASLLGIDFVQAPILCWS